MRWAKPVTSRALSEVMALLEDKLALAAARVQLSESFAAQTTKWYNMYYEWLWQSISSASVDVLLPERYIMQFSNDFGRVMKGWF